MKRIFLLFMMLQAIYSNHNTITAGKIAIIFSFYLSKIASHSKLTATKRKDARTEGRGGNLEEREPNSFKKLKKKKEM